MTTNIKVFHGQMAGAPQITNVFGDVYSTIKACLTTGFNLRGIESITRSGSIATANCTAGHGYEVGQWVLHEGAAQAEYNGEIQVLTKNTTQYTFAVSGTPVTPATGTITAKVAPLDFEEVYSGTNKGVFRSKNTLGPRHYLRLDDDQPSTEWVDGNSKGCKVTLAENMSDVDTFIAAGNNCNSLFEFFVNSTLGLAIGE